jgi:hypothetical protein
MAAWRAGNPPPMPLVRGLRLDKQPAQSIYVKVALSALASAALDDFELADVAAAAASGAASHRHATSSSPAIRYRSGRASRWPGRVQVRQRRDCRVASSSRCGLQSKFTSVGDRLSEPSLARSALAHRRDWLVSVLCLGRLARGAALAAVQVELRARNRDERTSVTCSRNFLGRAPHISRRTLISPIWLPAAIGLHLRRASRRAVRGREISVWRAGFDRQGANYRREIPAEQRTGLSHTLRLYLNVAGEWWRGCRQPRPVGLARRHRLDLAAAWAD